MRSFNSWPKQLVAPSMALNISRACAQHNASPPRQHKRCCSSDMHAPTKREARSAASAGSCRAMAGCTRWHGIMHVMTLHTASRLPTNGMSMPALIMMQSPAGAQSTGPACTAQSSLLLLLLLLLLRMCTHRLCPPSHTLPAVQGT
jgi:hypothetical protein